MPITVDLWMHPAAKAILIPLAESRSKSLVRRSLAVFDALVERCKELGAAEEAIAEVAPSPLVTLQYSGSDLRGWPATSDGHEIATSCWRAWLCMYQVGTLRSAIGILECAEEIFVVCLSAQVTAATRGDGFISDTDAALISQDLFSKLGLLIDLTWLEAA